MPAIELNAKVLKTLKCPEGIGKIDFHDKGCKGLMLEARKSGRNTWYLRYRDPRGKQRQFRIADTRDLSLEQARKRADELRGQIATGLDPAMKKAEYQAVPTLEAFVQERYLPFVKGYKRSWSTDESLLRNHILPRFGKRHLDEITKQDIVTMHHERKKAGAAPGSANRLLILMRYIFNLALKWETPGIEKNPTAGVPTFEENNKIERCLSPEDTERLFAAVDKSPNPMLRHIVALLILTGTRKREVLDARWEDFDLEKQLWRIPTTKTGKARHVPLSGGALYVLARVRETLHLHHLPTTGKAWLCPNLATGLPYVSFFASWNTARRKAGLSKVRIHDLRHTFASLLINSGRSLYEVQKILGHTQVRTTQRYAHLQQETLIEAADSAAKALSNALVPTVVLPATATLQLTYSPA
ncbi:MAG: tyrosine-type recombinase/integrase [Alcaligenaceae bacterium]|nr:tyrosine-type recombinase/integrase [Alcaligenaceae bacterium]